MKELTDLIASKLLEQNFKKSVTPHDYASINIHFLIKNKYINRVSIGGIIGFFIPITLTVFILILNIIERKALGLSLFGALATIFFSIMFAFWGFFIFMPSSSKVIEIYTDAYNDQEQLRLNIKNNDVYRRNQELLAKQQEEEQQRQLMHNEKLAYQRRMQEIEDIEAAKSRGQAKGLAELYKQQIELLITYKRQGADIDKEVFSMREKLMVLERQENSTMISDLMKTLDSI